MVVSQSWGLDLSLSHLSIISGMVEGSVQCSTDYNSFICCLRVFLQRIMEFGLVAKIKLLVCCTLLIPHRYQTALSPYVNGRSSFSDYL